MTPLKYWPYSSPLSSRYFMVDNIKAFAVLLILGKLLSLFDRFRGREG